MSPFYGWDSAVPGTPGRLLRQEPLPAEHMLVNASGGIRILYSSTDGLDGNTPIAVSGAVYFPKRSKPQEGWPVIAWAHGTTGVADICAPSWSMRSQRDVDYLNAWLDQGYAIVATDYQGLGMPGGHPWLAVQPEAFSVLDSIRAAVNAFPDLAKSVVLVGQSQGAHAVLSASLLAAHYAPDINVKATVATGVPGISPFLPDSAAPKITTPPLSGRNGLGYHLLLMHASQVMVAGFNASANVTDRAQAALDTAGTRCLGDLVTVLRQGGLTVENATKVSLDDLLSRLARFVQYPSVRFSTPVFVGTGLMDADTVPEGQFNFASAACFAGSTVELHYYPGMDHGGAVNPSLVDSVPFVKAAFSGQTIRGNCSAIRPPPAAP